MIDLSLVVAAYDMKREIPRTIRSLVPPYQRDLGTLRTEIIIADNGSAEPVNPSWFSDCGVELSVARFEPGDPSPCRAINAAARRARGRLLGIFVDGARMASPALLARAMAAMRLYPDVFVTTMGFHIGPAPQQVSLANGYDRSGEDALLAEIDWFADGYRLFDVSARGESYQAGVLGSFPETTAFMMHRRSFERIGGFHEGFATPGGGFSCYEFYDRVLSQPQTTPVLLIGEGTFHQVHSGSTTSAGGLARRVPGGQTLGETMTQEYVALMGRSPHSLPLPRPLLFGRCESAAAERAFFGRAAFAPSETAAS